MYFLNHLKAYSDFSYIDKRCKYLFYWLYANVLNKEQSTENTLILYKELYDRYNSDEDSMNILDNHIKQIIKLCLITLLNFLAYTIYLKNLKKNSFHKKMKRNAPTNALNYLLGMKVNVEKFMIMIFVMN